MTLKKQRSEVILAIEMAISGANRIANDSRTAVKERYSLSMLHSWYSELGPYSAISYGNDNAGERYGIRSMQHHGLPPPHIMQIPQGSRILKDVQSQKKKLTPSDVQCSD